ncbi:DUF3192 domain-containing protein [Haliea sp. E17]|uniref:DUF3192 domain-containing protein n=1 Tax=Haliea sp. E17 TaxID=3401576 RepID=UPI003AAE3B53
MPGLIAILLLSLAATGCVYVGGDVSGDEDWKQTQDKNRNAISSLDLGMSFNAVVERMGTPDDSEAFTDNGDEVRVLFYRTRHTNSDGETTRDETTPLVFRNGKLIGWGEEVYGDLR